MNDYTTVMIGASIACGAVLCIRIGRGWNRLERPVAGLMLVSAMLAVLLAFPVMLLAGLLQTVCEVALGICSPTSDTNIWNFVVMPLMAVPVNWILMLGSGRPR